MAMEEAEPVKAALANKDIVYIYQTGNSSPSQTWQNTIPDINGIHYRMNADQWDALCNKYQIDGVPSYMIIGKDGKQDHFESGFMGASNMKKILSLEASK